MLKLLIVDDETYTREGIMEMISWSSLGISEVRQAFDGVNALEIINEYNPNIILTDIKMPRMDGIELAINLRDLSPECAIIFMSSYSDKKYLKSAIQLKAINYVEKPLDLEELYNSINNAVLEILKLRSIKVNMENNIAIQLATTTDTNNIQDILNNCYSKNYVDSLKNSSIVNVIAKLFTPLPQNETMVIDSIKNLCTLYQYNSLITLKDDSELIIHLFKSNIDLSKPKPDNINLLLVKISEYLDNFTKHYISMGKIVDSIELIPKSYDEARKCLNNYFYFDYNSILVPNSETNESKPQKNIAYTEFEDLLKRKEKNLIFSYLQRLFKDFKTPNLYTTTFIKDIYYNLTLRVINFSKSKNTNLELNYHSQNILDDILAFNNVFELNNFLWSKINSLFESLETTDTFSEPIQEVIKYINKNFADPGLCLDEISKKTFLTSSYICVLFKDFMGTTVNKYINELRIEQAKSLLKKPEIKMKDVATKIGYSDGNYFAKIFKKETGYNPSDFRRKFSS